MTEWHPLRSLDDNKASALWSQYNKEAEKLAKAIPNAKMPSLDHLKMKDFEQVYEPSDDTYLLLDGLYYEFQEGVFHSMVHPLLVEIGCGSGVANVFLASLFLQSRPNWDSTVIVTDINPNALRVTQATAAAAAAATPRGATPIRLEAIQCDLLSAVLPRLEHAVDVLIFNPPYVPTPDDEVGSTGIEASWAGGVKGRRVIDRAVPQIAQILALPHGVGYMITVDDNEPELLAVEFEKLGLNMTPLVRRRAHNEYLTVQKLTWMVVAKETPNS